MGNSSPDTISEVSLSDFYKKVFYPTQYAKEPKKADYTYKCDETVKSNIEAASLLRKYYAHPSIRKWMIFSKYNGKFYKSTFERILYGYLYSLQHLKQDSETDALLLKIDVMAADMEEDIKDNRQRYQKHLKVFNENKEKVQLLKDYLINIGYTEHKTYYT